MNPLEQYIDSLLHTLLISKKRKREMTEEFMDHLTLLKQEFVLQGYAEKEASDAAIKAFGRDADIKNILGSGIAKNYRTLPNILFGLLLHLVIIRVGSHIPVPGGMNYYTLVMSGDPILVMFGMGFGIIATFWMFTTIGYFLPMFVPRLNKHKFYGISLLIGLGSLGYTFAQPSVLADNARIAICGSFTILCGSIIWSTFGYTLLKTADSLFTMLRTRLIKTGH